MVLLSPMTNKDLAQALSHVHLLTPISFAEREGEERGPDFLDPRRPAVNRFIDSLLAGVPGEPCWIDAGAGSEPVIGVLLHPGGVRLLLDRTRARPPGVPKT